MAAPAAHGEAGQERASDAVAYGPDDPGYGPPSADWYQRAEEARRREVEEEELRQARGPFEPLPPDHEVTAAPPAPAGDSPGGPDVELADGQEAAEPDDDLDVALVGQGAGPLERIKDLYVTAEAIGERRLDKHFEQLLERQRQLITDYFTKQEFPGPARAGRGPAGPGSGVPGVADDRPDGGGSESTARQGRERLSSGGAPRSPR